MLRYCLMACLCLLSASVSAKPESPLSVSLTAVSTTANQVELLAKVNSRISSARLHVNLLGQGGVTLLEGSRNWVGAVVAGESLEFRFLVEFDQPSHGRVVVRAKVVGERGGSLAAQGVYRSQAMKPQVLPGQIIERSGRRYRQIQIN